MSVIKRDGTKVVLPRTGPDEFWQTVHDHYAGDDSRVWKYLAMLALRENAGWPLDRIGNVFGHPKGHVTRCLRRITEELRVQFRMDPEFLNSTDDQPEDSAAQGHAANGPNDHAENPGGSLQPEASARACKNLTNPR